MSGIFHNPLLLSIDPWMIILPLRLIVTYCSLKSAVHPASHNFPIETSGICVRLGMMYPSHASLVKAGKYIKHGLIY